MRNPLVFVVYDSIHHSIFEGQVLAPLLKKLAAGLHPTINIISFEETLSPAVLAAQKKFSALHPALTLTIIKRPRFTFAFLLQYQAQQLRAILTKFSTPYDLYARGPLAGLIAHKATTLQCAALTIQARGLLAQEHCYTHRSVKGWRFYAHALRQQQLWHIEKECYTAPLNASYSFSIEAVSPALEEYLQHTYHTPPSLFVAPHFDTPDPVSHEKKLLYRTQVRKKLAIPENATVYVYNGSLKPWQCPQETIAAFKKMYEQDKTAFYLALTQDTQAMRMLLDQTYLPKTAFAVLHVPQSDVIRYLCAGDFGLLFREQHPLNWVSRPTKLLEYQAAGLQVVHNNTIALLSQN